MTAATTARPARLGAAGASRRSGGHGRMRKDARARCCEPSRPTSVGRGPLLDGPPASVWSSLPSSRTRPTTSRSGWPTTSRSAWTTSSSTTTAPPTAARELLERYINHGLVTRIDWPIGGGQLSAYNHALRMFGDDDRVAGLLRRRRVPGAAARRRHPLVPGSLRRCCGSCVCRASSSASPGIGRQPEGLSIDAYTQVANVLDLDPELPPRVKSIVQPGRGLGGRHPPRLPRRRARHRARRPRRLRRPVRGVAQLNHYYTRSLEEFEAKRFRGSRHRSHRPAGGGLRHRDHRDQRRGARATRSGRRPCSSACAASSPGPTQYGSQLGVRVLPPTQRPLPLRRIRHRQLPLPVCSSPRASPTIRLKNLYGGVGLVADISTRPGMRRPATRSPTRSTPRCSCEHMRGRIETTLSVAPDAAHAAPSGHARRCPTTGRPRWSCPAARPSVSSRCRLTRCCAATRSGFVARRRRAGAHRGRPCERADGSRRRRQSSWSCRPPRAWPASSRSSREPHARVTRCTCAIETAAERLDALRPLRHLDRLGWRHGV